jgi:Mor family transcriptional regulator
MSRNTPDLIVKFPEGYPELYDDMGQIVSRELYAMGFPPENSKQGAFRIMDTIRRELGGSVMYLPKGLSYDLSPRDQEIFDKFNGRNYYELAREYDLTEMQVRNIVKKGLDKLRSRQQRPLFDPD